MRIETLSTGLLGSTNSAGNPAKIHGLAVVEYPISLPAQYGSSRGDLVEGGGGAWQRFSIIHQSMNLVRRAPSDPSAARCQSRRPGYPSAHAKSRSACSAEGSYTGRNTTGLLYREGNDWEQGEYARHGIFRTVMWHWVERYIPATWHFCYIDEHAGGDYHKTGAIPTARRS